VGTDAVLNLTRPAGTYTFTLTVTDPYGAADSDVVVITIKPQPNRPPIANPGMDQMVTVAHDIRRPTSTASLTLDGSASSDPDGDALSYEWKENGAVVGTAATLNLSRAVGDHTFTLTVTDPYGAFDSDDVIVTIKPQPNRQPIANPGMDQMVTVPH